MRVSIGLVALWAASLPAVAQQPEGAAPPPEAVAQSPAAAAQPPVFGVGVDVVAVDASVVDADGRPVLGLGPEDFRVEVDGKPRRIVTVDYLGRDLEPPVPAAPRPVHFSSNEDAPRGRLVLLLVDRGNIGRGGGREVHEGGRALPGDARARRPRRARVRAGARASSSSSPRTSTWCGRG